MTNRLIVAFLILLSSSVAAAQGVSVTRADYTEFRNGEQVGAGSFVFSSDGKVRHDRLDRNGVVMVSHIWTDDGNQRVDIDHALRTATPLAPGMIRVGRPLIRSPNALAGEQRHQGLPLGPRAVGPLVLEGHRFTVPERPGRPAMVMELWGYRIPGQMQMHFLERSVTSTLLDGTPDVTEMKVVSIQQGVAADGMFSIPAGVTMADPVPFSAPAPRVR